jgi:hypothetical protein
LGFQQIALLLLADFEHLSCALQLRRSDDVIALEDRNRFVSVIVIAVFCALLLALDRAQPSAGDRERSGHDTSDHNVATCARSACTERVNAVIGLLGVLSK